MANDVHRFNMAVYIANTNLKCVELTIPSSFYFLLSDIPMVPIYYALIILIPKKLNNIKGSCHYLLSSLGVPLKPSTINR